MQHPLNQKLERKNILVTGGAGFIGCALANHLNNERYSLFVVDNLLSRVHPHQERPLNLKSSIELLVADISEKATCINILKNFCPHIIVHLAAETSTGQSLREASKHARTNVLGLTQLLDTLAMNEVFPQQIVLTSSRAVYGEGAWQTKDGRVFYPGQRSNAQLSSGQWDFDGMPLSSVFGTTKENPTSVYGGTKLAQENILRSWALSFNVPISILRLQNVYGPGQSSFNPYTGIVILFSRLAKNKQMIELYEDGLVTRDFIFIDDVVDALAKSIAREPENGSRELDIGSGTTVSLIEVANMITEFYSAPSAVICGKYRNGDVRHARCDISGAVTELSWQPRWTLADGLIELQNYLSENHLEVFN